MPAASPSVPVRARWWVGLVGFLVVLAGCSQLQHPAVQQGQGGAQIHGGGGFAHAALVVHDGDNAHKVVTGLIGSVSAVKVR